jgi:hypothetical protein
MTDEPEREPVSDDELDDQDGEELAAREAMSLVQLDPTIPVEPSVPVADDPDPSHA